MTSSVKKLMCRLMELFNPEAILSFSMEQASAQASIFTDSPGTGFRSAAK